jgi:nitrite reductase/ring-hydroxylating ferredoxin subunit
MEDHLQDGRDRAMNLALAGAALCRLDDIGDPGGKGFSFGEASARREIFVVRRGRQIFGYVNACPHVGTTLDWRPDEFLTFDKRRLLCGTHGAVFDIATGACLKGPCAGKALTPVAVALEGDTVVLKETLD